MNLRYTRRALRHLEAIAAYVSEHDPAAAQRVGVALQRVVRVLESFPRLGRVGVLSGTRELVVQGLPYIVVYRIEPDDNLVVILGIYHGAQLRPGQE